MPFTSAIHRFIIFQVSPRKLFNFHNREVPIQPSEDDNSYRWTVAQEKNICLYLSDISV